MPKRNQSLPTPPDADDKGKEDRKPPSLPSIMNSESRNLTVGDAAGPTTSAMEGAAPASANSASASSTSVRTRVTEGPEVYPPTEPAPVHSDEKNTLKGTSDVARLPRAPANDLCTREITLEVTKYPSQVDTEEDKAVDNASQDASVPGDSRIAVSATPEVYPPTPIEGSLDNADVHANNQKMQRKSAKASTAELPPCPEDVPIEDPRECHDHADESRALRTGKMRRNRATEGTVTDPNEMRSQADDDGASSAETQDVPDIFGDEPSSDQSSPAPQTTPGAVAVPGINTNDDDMEIAHCEQPGPRTPEDAASDNEATTDSQEDTLQVAIGAHVVNERGQGTGTRRNAPADEMLRERIFTEAPLVSAEAVQDLSESPDAEFMSRIFFSKFRSRRTLLILAFFMAVILAAATLMGVLIPKGSTAASQEVIQESQPSAAPSSIPTSCPSHLPSLTPTDPDTLRFNSIRFILVPISGLEVLLDTATPQYRALEWVSHIDPLWLPYKTEAERKRVIQRYVLAVLYFASGGQHWRTSCHFLKGIHECDWWSYSLAIGGKVSAQGALCTKGREVGKVDQLLLVDNNMTGTLPAELRSLSDLDRLEISDNYKLGGPIPGFDGNMTSLTRLDLRGNCPFQERFGRHGNGLTGTIPESFGKLTGLQYLNLASNKLNGTIPSVMGQLSSLQRLYLYDNGLTGTIPKSFENLMSLQWLNLADNMLNGTIPSVMGQLSSLGHLDLDRNRLTGEIPNEICRRKESNDLPLSVYARTVNGTELLCECIPVEGLSGCCVVTPEYVGDGSCHPDEPYYSEACKYDNGDCPAACPEGTSPVAGKNMFACCVAHPYYIGDGKCDDFEAYNTEACGYDGGDCCESTCEGWRCGRNGYNCKDPTVNVTCLDAEGLEGCCVEHPSKIGDGYCHPYAPYYTEACKYDNRDCPAACPEGTSPVAGKNMSACCVSDPDVIGDGDCDNDEPYNMAACGWDGGDCIIEGLPECLGIDPSWIGNGDCDVSEPYNTEACEYDGGDCCESTCEGSDCGENGYDCKDPTVNVTCFDAEGLEGCCVEHPSRIGDGYCHPYAPYYTEACKYDQGDCPAACPEGTSPVAGKNMSACCVSFPDWVGDGYCDNPLNTAACGWDGGDCCEETCEGSDCGIWGYDCKDPTISNR